MSDTTVDAAARPHAAHHHADHSGRPNLDGGGHAAGIIVFLVLLGFGLFWTLRGLALDISASDTPALRWAPSCCWVSRC